MDRAERTGPALALISSPTPLSRSPVVSGAPAAARPVAPVTRSTASCSTGAAAPVLHDAVDLVTGATGRAAAGAPDTTGDLLRGVGELMSAKAGPVRSARSIAEALAQVRAWLAGYRESVSADGRSRRAVDRTFLVRDILTT